VAPVAMISRWLAVLRGRSARRVPGAAGVPQLQAAPARLGSPLAVAILVGVEPEVRGTALASRWRFERPDGGADRRTLSGILCNRLSPMPDLHIVKLCLQRNPR
jgi:hypothetical protein